MTKKAALIILDGWGIGDGTSSDAISNAHTPFTDSLYDQYPHAELLTDGENVGLPTGQMGNSEVGHMNIGAGRVVWQMLAKINRIISNGELSDNKEWQELIYQIITNYENFDPIAIKTNLEKTYSWYSVGRNYEKFLFEER